MALDATVLAELAFSKYSERMREEHPNAVLSRKLIKIPRDDGSVDYNFVEETGPIEVSRREIMPLLTALSEALVEHLTVHGEVQSVASGTITRNIT